MAKTAIYCVYAMLFWASAGSAVGSENKMAWFETAQRHDLDVQTLYAVALAESGRYMDGGVTAWPWTIRGPHGGRYFDTRQEAVDALRGMLDEGVKPIQIDVGIMQVNLHYHGRRVTDAADLLDPAISLETGAAILAEAVERTGDIWTGVGAYNTSKPEIAARYVNRVKLFRTALTAGEPTWKK